MKCSDFLSGYTDLRDGELSVAEARPYDEHRSACPTCRRYDRVVSRGTDLLRAVPVEPRKEDFQARLEHSIYALHEEHRRRRMSRAGSGAMSLLATAAVVAAVMLASLIGKQDAAVDLPPLVVEGPSAPLQSLLVRSPYPVSVEMDLWNRSNALLYQHSSLYLRYREPGLVLTGLR